MSNISVIVIPEKKVFELKTTHELLAHTNLNLGMPKLKEKGVKYFAPFWLDTQQVDRLYHIQSLEKDSANNCTNIKLGNAFVLKEPWNKMGQKRAFEYHSLSDFDMVEIKEGILMHYKH